MSNKLSTTLVLTMQIGLSGKAKRGGPRYTCSLLISVCHDIYRTSTIKSSPKKPDPKLVYLYVYVTLGALFVDTSYSFGSNIGYSPRP